MSGLLTAHDGQGMAQALHLLFLTHLVGSRACGERAYINDLAALRHDLVGAVCNLFLRLLAASGKETVGGAVEDAHHNRLLEREQTAFNI